MSTAERAYSLPSEGGATSRRGNAFVDRVKPLELNASSAESSLVLPIKHSFPLLESEGRSTFRKYGKRVVKTAIRFASA